METTYDLICLRYLLGANSIHRAYLVFILYGYVVAVIVIIILRARYLSLTYAFNVLLFISQHIVRCAIRHFLSLNAVHARSFIRILTQFT